MRIQAYGFGGKLCWEQLSSGKRLREHREALRCLVSPALGKICCGTQHRGKRRWCGPGGGPAEMELEGWGNSGWVGLP